MAKIVKVIDFPTLSVADLKELVVAHDASNDEHPIETQYVKPSDVIDLLTAEEFPDVPIQTSVTFEE